jgi:hypothetical protein
MCSPPVRARTTSSSQCRLREIGLRNLRTDILFGPERAGHDNDGGLGRVGQREPVTRGRRFSNSSSRGP